MQNTFNILSKIHSHERDLNIDFEEEGHKYIIKNDLKSVYTSVTTWNHLHFPKFNADSVIINMFKSKNWKEGHKYWGLSLEEIKNLWKANGETVSSAGTDLHYKIECFMNNENLVSEYTHNDLLHDYEKYEKDEKDVNDSKEWYYFLEFIRNFPNLKPYRTEWVIYDEELKIAGSIDMVYENEDGTLSIYDWKRSKEINRVNNYNKYAITKCISHLPDSNFWHYALQLNTYKVILERKYNKIVKDLFLVRLHPDAEEKSYELIELPILKREIDDLINERLLQIK
jgi:hypothetical protein